MQKIIILKGLPASGKSTWALEMTAKFDSYKRINKDDLRAMLGNKWSRNTEKYIIETRDVLIEKYLNEGFSVIVDDTNFAPEHEKKIREIATLNNAEVEVKFFDTPLEDCIARDAKRPKPVGEKVIREMHRKYLTKGKIELIKYNPDLTDIVLCDLDGTLALMDGNRSPYEWHRVGEDRVNKPVEELVHLLATKYPIILLSGRDAVCWIETISWLDKNQIPYTQLFMRPEGDTRKDVIVKKEIFDEFIKDKFNVKFVIDDRLSVCRQWYAMGLPLLRVGDPESNF